MSSLRLIGYWKSEDSAEWPEVTQFVDEGWDDTERHMVAVYLSNGTVARQWRGWSYCRICGEQNGDSDLTDGVFIWPEGLAHYVHVHAVRLPADFVSHAVSRLDELESAEVDGRWWAQQAAAD